MSSYAVQVIGGNNYYTDDLDDAYKYFNLCDSEGQFAEIIEFLWEARAEYSDGFSIEKYFPQETGTDDEQHRIEEWLLNAHDDCTWFSVGFATEQIA